MSSLGVAGSMGRFEVGRDGSCSHWSAAKRSRLDQRCRPLGLIKCAYLRAHIIDLTIRQRRIHRKQEATRKETCGAWKFAGKTERAELMNGPATPLNDRFNAVGFQV